MSLRPAQLHWTSAGVTHPGRVRDVNQDAYLDRPDLGLWAVADGMGGHSDGGMASRMLVDGLGRMGRPGLLGSAVESVRNILQEVNRRLLDDAAARGDDLIGSTIVALVAVGDHCAILWVGDSRVYRRRNGELVQLTLDHTHVQDLVDKGMLTPEQAEQHPLSNVLVRAVGADAEMAVDLRVEALRDGDRFLLCSDGLVKELRADVIAGILCRAEPGEVARDLVEAACDAGGRDNITAVIVDIHR
ncbi:PP2C family protein-serine/threonine phosphatase [Thiocapsa roseopersicina]|uniref:Protein phosphatase n=1 Tax=Thiocapsa roseopersicina TaxID=1058 RepID=A0A1H2VSR9_THIRO|nr:protein phosphatase 2C domain-containing protein [Thiocapsa roseopersicina]SDW70929.1 protein phosphatase [Thiocapsa roseopersicina]